MGRVSGPRFPLPIRLRHTHRTRPIPRSTCRICIEKKHPVLHIATPGNSAQRPRTIKTPINLATPMPTKLPGLVTQVLDAARAHQAPGTVAHALAWRS